MVSNVLTGGGGSSISLMEGQGYSSLCKDKKMAAPSGRKYSKYDKAYQARPEQVKKRVMRNAAHRLMVKNHGKAPLKGKDVDHKRGTEAGNGASNLRIVSRSKNRAKK